MKPSGLLIFILIAFYSCSEKKPAVKTTETLSETGFIAELRNTSQSTLAVLNKYSSEISIHAKADTGDFRYGDNNFPYGNDEEVRHVVIGKFIDSTQLTAIEFNDCDTLVEFYAPKNGSWKQVGTGTIDADVYGIGSEEMTGDDKKEIVISSSPNMNGNNWRQIFYYLENKDSILFAGSFFSGNYQTRPEKKQIEVVYIGSYYMDESKTLYEWRDERIIPMKMVVIADKPTGAPDPPARFKYYENPSKTDGGIMLKFNQVFKEKNKWQRQFWYQFFDDGY